MIEPTPPPFTAVPVPAISVVMSARNEAPYIDAAVASVLAQRFADFEFVIRDDGSTDDTAARLEAWAARDPRIQLFRGDRALGLSGSGDFVVGKARAPLVARMDADDIAEPDWLVRLHDTIIVRPDVVLVGCLWTGIDMEGREVRVADRWRAAHPSVHPPFGHGSSLFRKAAFDRIGGYRATCEYWEDLDVVLRLARIGTILFVPEPLYRYRFAATSTRLISAQHQVEQAIDTMFDCAAQYRTTGNYEALLHARADAPAHVPTPRTLIALSSNRLWNGQRPGKFGRMMRYTRWPASRETPISLLIGLWSELAPRSLRALLATLIRLRAPRGARALGTAPVVWAPLAGSGNRHDTPAVRWPSDSHL